jgi:hypothetical protein
MTETRVACPERPTSSRLGGLWLVGTLVAAGAFIFWVWQPGLPFSDSSNMIWQHLDGYPTDQWSPMLGIFWEWAYRLFGYPRGPFILDTGVVLVAIGCWVTLLPVRWLWRCLIALLVIASPIFLDFSTVVRDVPFAGTSLFAITMVAHARRRTFGRRWPWVVAALAALVAIISFRQEGILSTLPACAGLVTLLLVGTNLVSLPVLRRSLRSTIITVTLTGVLVAAVFETASLIEYHAIGASKSDAYQQQALWDLAALSVSTGHILIPGGFQQNVTMPFLRRFTLDRTGDELFWPASGNRGDPSQKVIWRYDPHDLALLRHAWLHAVIDHPVALIKHRLAVADWSMSVTESPPFYLVEPLNSGSTPGYLCFDAVHALCPTPPSAAARWLQGHSVSDRTWIIFREWPYSIMALLVLLASLWRRRRRSLLAIALAASSLLESTAVIIVGIGYSYRYELWPMLASITAVLTWICAQSVQRTYPQVTDRPTAVFEIQPV